MKIRGASIEALMTYAPYYMGVDAEGRSAIFTKNRVITNSSAPRSEWPEVVQECNLAAAALLMTDGKEVIRGSDPDKNLV